LILIKFHYQKIHKKKLLNGLLIIMMMLLQLLMLRLHPKIHISV